MRAIDADRLLTDRMKEHYYHLPNGDIAIPIIDIEHAPSIVPERKRGRWIKMPEYCGDDVSGFIDNHFSCSECKKEAEINQWGFYILSDFCPNCGAYMGEKGEE